MSPEEVPAELVELAPSPVDFAGRGLSAEQYVRALLAAVLPEYGAQVLEGVRGLVDAGSWLLLAERAAHLREGGES